MHKVLIILAVLFSSSVFAQAPPDYAEKKYDDEILYYIMENLANMDGDEKDFLR